MALAKRKSWSRKKKILAAVGAVGALGLGGLGGRQLFKRLAKKGMSKTVKMSTKQRPAAGYDHKTSLKRVAGSTDYGGRARRRTLNPRRLSQAARSPWGKHYPTFPGDAVRYGVPGTLRHAGTGQNMITRRTKRGTLEGGPLSKAIRKSIDRYRRNYYNSEYYRQKRPRSGR